jgi:hypothetical protein
MRVFSHHSPHYLKRLHFEDSDAWSGIGAFHFITDMNQGKILKSIHLPGREKIFLYI